ncbi:MAG: hypothetical protein IAG10_17010 [Planctomycetaceae bacterium]|nr:hypothetical protein [Planctomycetaceae bacterium]
MSNNIPNYWFGNSLWIEAETRRESAWKILQLWHAVAIQEDKPGYDAASGTVMTGPWSIRTPDRRLFRMEEMTFTTSYWKASLIRFCEREERVWGEINDGRFVLSDTSSFSIDEIEFEVPKKRERK